MDIKSLKNGLFLTLEGGEGAGKTTQARKLKDHLEAQGYQVVLTREPGGTPEAEKIRDLLVQRDGGEWTPMAEIVLFFAARQMHVEQLIKPALFEGKIVICDRFTDSTRAYQGYGHGFDLNVIEDLRRTIIGEFEPDLTLVFDLPVSTGLRRSIAHKNKASGTESTEDKFEGLDVSFHERMRQGYRDIAEDNPQRCRIVDASLSPQQIFENIKVIVEEKLSHAV